MHFIIRCVDKPGSGALRAETRPAHLDYLKSVADKLKVAGPTLAEDNETPNGSLLIIEAADRSEADALTAHDPYTKAGLFESVMITPWKWVIDKPEK